MMKLFLLSLFALSTASVQAYELAGHWEGTYEYNDLRPSVSFSMNLYEEYYGELSGSCSEPATFGDHSWGNLYSRISGSVSGSYVSFTKTYDGSDGVSHSVSYRGTVDSYGRSINGSWSRIGGNSSGSFWMQRSW